MVGDYILHQLLQLRTRSMEPKKDDPETILGPSDRSIENVDFLLNCLFYGAKFITRKIALFVHLETFFLDNHCAASLPCRGAHLSSGYKK